MRKYSKLRFGVGGCAKICLHGMYSVLLRDSAQYPARLNGDAALTRG